MRNSQLSIINYQLSIINYPSFSILHSAFSILHYAFSILLLYDSRVLPAAYTRPPRLFHTARILFFFIMNTTMQYHSLSSAFFALTLSLIFPISLRAQESTPLAPQTHIQTASAADQSAPQPPQTASQTSPVAATPDQQTLDANPSTAMTLSDALKATPPERKKMAQMLLNSPDALSEIDPWIQNTEVDNPQNLILKDILMGMPIAFAGPRLTELAKKSNDPGIQQNWVRWLEKYPDAYAQVLVAWLKLNQDNTPRFASLLTDYYQLRPEQAVYLWAQSIALKPLKELENLYAFGLDKQQCAFWLTEQILQTQDETPQLRLLRALAHCTDASSISNDQKEPLDNILLQYLNHTAPSRRIAALDAIGTVKPQNADILNRTAALYKEAKNTTERTVALRSLAKIDPASQNANVRDALIHGDETLRIGAAALLANLDGIEIPYPDLKAAFTTEIWPETQMLLYQAMAKRIQNQDELGQLRKSILLDETRAIPMRSNVLTDIVQNTPKLLTLADMEKLISQNAPLDLIAQTAESIYATHPNSRPKLRTWLEAQQPFERRILSTFARFMHIDAKEKDASAIDFMRTICNSEEPQESTLQPCLIYFEANGQTDADKALVEKLQRRQNQFDAMMNLDFL